MNDNIQRLLFWFICLLVLVSLFASGVFNFGYLKTAVGWLGITVVVYVIIYILDRISWRQPKMKRRNGTQTMTKKKKTHHKTPQNRVLLHKRQKGR